MRPIACDERGHEGVGRVLDVIGVRCLTGHLREPV